MAVTFSGVTLADSAADGFDGAEGIDVRSRGVIQTQPVIDSDAPFFKHRGNKLFTVTFRSRKRHADAAAAKAFVGTHATALAGPGSFSGFGLGLENAECQVASQVTGIVTYHSYTITGAHNPG
jgi:hypothetical protein